MKRLLVAALAAVGLARLYCAWRGHANARRQPMGGFRCPPPCWKAHATLPTLDGGRVHPIRRTFDREHIATIRSAGW